MNASRLASAIGLAFLATAACAAPKSGWQLTGDDTAEYRFAPDASQTYSGSASTLLASTSEAPRGFGGLIRGVAAQPYKGKRVRLSAFVKTAGVKNWSGLWLRVDGQKGPPGLAFDNMHDRPIVGDSEWREYSVVLDVPDEAARIAYGALLTGPGKVWVDSVRLESVP